MPVSAKQAKALSNAGVPTSVDQEEANLSGATPLVSSTVNGEVKGAEKSASSKKGPSLPTAKSINGTVGHDELVAGALGGLVAEETSSYVNQQVGPITGGSPGSAIPGDPVGMGPYSATK